MLCMSIARRVRFAASALAATAAALALAPSIAAAQSVDWSKSPPLGPIARIENSMVWCGGKMVMFGGYDLNFNRMQDLWEYDTTAKTWTNHTPSPLPLLWPSRRAGHAMACNPATQRVYVFGGWTDNGAEYLNGIFLNDMWEWNTANKTWADRTPVGLKPAPRRHSSSPVGRRPHSRAREGL